MKRRILYGILIAALTVNLGIGAKIYFSTARAANKDNAYPSLELFSYVMEKVRKDYVDGKELSYSNLVYGSLKGMISTLDPHSEFMEPDKFQELQNDTEGRFGGLGIVISMKDNFVTVVAPMEDTPGFKAGILTGDRIIRIDGKSTEKMSLQDAVKNLRGEPGTDVAITILRPSSGKVKEYKLTRAEIKVDMVKDINGKKEFPLGADKVGYVRLIQFGEKTGSELDNALRKLKSQGMKALVLDLRWNPGGLLDQAVEVCEKFLGRGKLVVTTEGRNSAQNSRRVAGGRGDMLVNKDGSTMPMVILVNMGSASASEIVAGCLQDWHRAYVMGEQTFGKGSVQSILPLQDGSALRLTTAKYYTPSHKVIHEQGITPDSFVQMLPEEERDLLLQRIPGGIESLEEKDRDRVRNARDQQLDRAVDYLKAIMIFTSRESDVQKVAAKKEKTAAN
jgi:carboxyl-terminal processing protease